MPDLPTGTVTFLFTDVEGSTRLWEAFPQAMRVAVVRHNKLLHQAVESSGGVIFKTVGDGICAAFATAPHALAAALQAQLALHAERWAETGPLRVRMALHTGAVEVQDGDYVAPCLNRAARLLAVAHGGQVLVSQATANLAHGSLPDGVSLGDLGEHRLRDLLEPERVFQLGHPDLPPDFPPLKSLDAYPNNLPLQPSSFVGRDREIAEVTERLRTTRLLTLTGTGGCGKTRLALQVAAETLTAFRDGVWFVDLALLSDPALVAQAVATALGVREQPGRPLIEVILGYLRERALLLVLDNCEHLIDASAYLADALLARCPGVRLLVTSRELLGVRGETVLRVPSLSLPAPEQESASEAVARCEAIQLFVERARALAPDFAVTDQNASALARICRRLDGIPLALELAAARVRVLTAEQIALRLDDRFRLLTGGGRTALRRQQTLQATIDWSHDLLAERERTLFRRLAVFAGGWSIEAAEQVCAFEGLDSFEVLDLLTSLADKSLVVAESRAEMERYRLSETIRQYAQDKLLQSGEAAAVRERHREWYRELARRAEPELRGPRAGAWLDRLEAEHDNLRAELTWCREAPEAAGIGLEIAGNLGWFWDLRGHSREGTDWLETFLVLAPARTSARARALLSLEQKSRLALRSEAARAAAEEARLIYEETGDLAGTAEAISRCGLLAANDGDYATGRALLEESLAMVRALGDQRAALDRLRDLAIVGIAEGKYGRARALLEESLAIAEGRNVRPGLGMGMLRLAIVDRLEGDFSRSRSRVQQSLTLLEESRHAGYAELARVTLANLARQEGRFAEARAILTEGLVRYHGYGDRVVTAMYTCCLGLLAIEHGAHARGVHLLGAGAMVNPLFGTIHEPDLRVEAAESLAAARTALGEEAFARAWAEGQAMTLEQAVEYALKDDAEV